MDMFSEAIKQKKELKVVAEKLINRFPNQRIFAFYGKMGAVKPLLFRPFVKYWVQMIMLPAPLLR